MAMWSRFASLSQRRTQVVTSTSLDNRRLCHRDEHLMWQQSPQQLHRQPLRTPAQKGSNWDVPTMFDGASVPAPVPGDLHAAPDSRTTCDAGVHRVGVTRGNYPCITEALPLHHARRPRFPHNLLKISSPLHHSLHPCIIAFTPASWHRHTPLRRPRQQNNV
eukprot:SAG31_NODE_3190_length_4571_cov_3.184481_6_plen_162_part_00